MKPVTDCNGIPYPVYTIGRVNSCTVVEGAVPSGSVYCLNIDVTGDDARLPLPGQFFMLRSVKSGLLLARPISVYHAESIQDGYRISFMILLKGKGTQELCSLVYDDKIQILGPLGNIFPRPKHEEKKVCIVGGGIGVAPVANFAESLESGSYDFFASFKSGSYGLEYIKPNKLKITTDDGSVGIKGMLPAALNEELIRHEHYSAIYACGPIPMLAYVKSIAEACGVQCYLSMESRMACGVGVCLGCVIKTTEGNLRVCKDGPVFDSRILSFPKPEPRVVKEPLSSNPDMSFNFKGVVFKNPLIGSSGTFGFGKEYTSIFDVNLLGGMSSKGLTLEPRQGNDGIRLWETPSGLMNSIGLQNPGIPYFIDNILPDMLKMDPVTIVNLSGSTLESYVEGAKLLEKTKAPVIELNISCPNVKAGGAAFGMKCDTAGLIVSEIRKATTKPLIVKLTPQAHELMDVAHAVIEAGADGISLCNSFQGVVVDIETGRPVFDKVKAGFGGPAVRPIAVRLIYELYQELLKLPEDKRIPIFAIGGIADWRDVVEYIMVGASAVQVGTMTLANPFAMIECIDGLKKFMIRKGYKSLDEMRGIAH